MSAPRVTVVMAVHDGARFLAEALGDLAAQTLTDHEVVVVDDGSRDASAAIARGFPGVRVLGQTRRGPAAARNRGIAEAHGALVCFLDADDRWPPDRLARQVARHEAEPGLAFTVGRYRAFLHDDTPRPPWLRPEWLDQGAVGFFAGTLMVRRDAFARVGTFDPARAVGETADWFVRAHEARLPFAVLPDLLLLRRVHGENLSYRGDEINASIFASLKASLDRRRAGTGQDA